MPKKTAAQKLEALLEKATELLEDIELDAKLKHETGLGRSLADMASADVYTDDEINQLLSDYDIDSADLQGVRAGLRMASKMIGDHDLDVDTDDDISESAADEAQHQAEADDVDELEP